MSDFLPEPLPFKCANLSFELCDAGKPLPALAIGVKLTTQAPNGLKIIPTYEVAINLSKTDGSSEQEFRISARWARDLSKALQDYASMCDQLNAAGKA